MESSSIQKMLLQAIHAQLPSYLSDWRCISTYFYTLPEPEIQEVLLTLLPCHGFTAQKLDQNLPIIYAEYATNAPHTVLFVLTYQAESLLPRAQHLISPLVSQMAAIQIYQTHIGHLPLNLKWLFIDKNMPDHAAFIRLMTDHHSLLQADTCIFYTTKQEISQQVALPELSLGMKGHLQVELTIQTAQRAIPAGYGAIAPNAAWQLVWGLQSIKDSHEEILIEGFYDMLLPPEDETIESITQFPNTTSQHTEQWGTKQLLLGLNGIQQHYAHFLTPTCTITEFHSPVPTNNAETATTIPSTANARLDFQLVPDQNPSIIFSRLQQQLAPYNVQAHLLAATLPHYTSIKKPFAQHLHNSLYTAYQQTPILIPLSTQTDVYEQIIHNQLAIPTLRLALPSLGEEPEQQTQHLVHTIYQQALFFASSDSTKRP
ncbi:peptidase dimerization domain-containing protein [Dictyobacter arantiisoli]|uniref:Peptidase M20 dimerisation domain-containing protein n=1 Tax=Dictyobacter arantiisoli TaxID=2014874 RepID=A0A5A5T9A0_9CHLR|nr:peptidase dimerization domain-containing protein [Dictyobacter arantiisoli]GCF07897.1 hypothetical protein KDI_14610 [Dictyobacter arantiisoli]